MIRIYGIERLPIVVVLFIGLSIGICYSQDTNSLNTLKPTEVGQLNYLSAEERAEKAEKERLDELWIKGGQEFDSITRSNYVRNEQFANTVKFICNCSDNYRAFLNDEYNNKVPFVPIVKLTEYSKEDSVLNFSITTIVNYNSFEKSHLLENFIICPNDSFLLILENGILDLGNSINDTSKYAILNVYDRNSTISTYQKYFVYEINRIDTIFQEYTEFSVPDEYLTFDPSIRKEILENSIFNISIDSIRKLYPDLINF
jgi:hypothetical protein